MVKNKTLQEKIKTKFDGCKTKNQEYFTFTATECKYKDRTVFTINDNILLYTKNRIYLEKKEPCEEEEYEVEIILSEANLKIVNSNMLKVPSGVKSILRIFYRYNGQVNKIIIGTNESSQKGEVLHITTDLYSSLVLISKEEKVEADKRIEERTNPIIVNDFIGIESKNKNIKSRNYKLILKELIASKNITIKDIQEISKDIKGGNENNILIDQRLKAQVEWLVGNIKSILDTDKLNKSSAKTLGNDLFGYLKKDIKGPEHLMEKILSDYGKESLFGVPVLLNTDKYAKENGMPKIQFDILMLDTLSDIQVVELKRPDTFVLEYDSNRAKFYPSKDLSVAIGQSERYISALYKNSSDDIKIGNKTIKKYLSEELNIKEEDIKITRPTALIIIGKKETVFAPYKPKKGSSLTEGEYNRNGEISYLELRGTHKNIKIVTYSELLDAARLRYGIKK